MVNGISETRQADRMIRTYQVVTLAVALFSLIWSLVFFALGHIQIAIVELYPVAAGLMCFALVSMRRLNLFLVVAQVSFLIFIIVFCLLYDVPNRDYPRVTHLFLPVLAMLGYLNHLRSPSLPQAGLILAAVIAFIFLHASGYTSAYATPIPDELRAVGVWLNATVTTLMFSGLIFALQRRLAAPRGMIRDLLSALRRGELSLAYQPQVDRHGHVVSAEALLRWTHPVKGPVSPASFIPLAEEAGVMPLVGTWVLEQAALRLAQWQADPVLARLTLSVNVSASQFNEADFAENLQAIMKAQGVDPSRLRLELTESVLIAGLDRVAATMDELRRLGFTFSLDDFGTGYSSLAYLRRLPVTEMKIDRSFVSGAIEHERDATLIRSIIGIGRDLGCTIVAEGVETPAQHALLHAQGCDLFQGWLFGRPVAADAFEALARQPEPLAQPLPARDTPPQRRAAH